MSDTSTDEDIRYLHIENTKDGISVFRESMDGSTTEWNVKFADPNVYLVTTYTSTICTVTVQMADDCNTIAGVPQDRPFASSLGKHGACVERSYRAAILELMQEIEAEMRHAKSGSDIRKAISSITTKRTPPSTGVSS